MASNPNTSGDIGMIGKTTLSRKRRSDSTGSATQENTKTNAILTSNTRINSDDANDGNSNYDGDKVNTKTSSGTAAGSNSSEKLLKRKRSATVASQNATGDGINFVNSTPKFAGNTKRVVSATPVVNDTALGGINTVVSYSLLDDGTVRSDGRRYYDCVQLSSGTETYTIRTGTPVYLYKENVATTDLHGNQGEITYCDDWLCCVDGFFYDNNSDDNNQMETTQSNDRKWMTAGHTSLASNTSRSNSKRITSLRMVASWFLSPKDVMGLGKRFKFLPFETRTFRCNEVILSNIQEEHDAATILSVCRFGDLESPITAGVKSMNKVWQKNIRKIYDPKLMLPTCRYKVIINSKKCTVQWTNYDPNSRNTNEFHSKNTSGMNNNRESLDDQTMPATTNDDNDDRSNDEYDSELDIDGTDDKSNKMKNSIRSPLKHITKRSIPSNSIKQGGEGSALRGDIAVGQKYQVSVKQYNPEEYKNVRSRKPKLVWKPMRDTQLTDEALHTFLSELETIHTKYLKDNNLIILNEPYTPLKSAHAEQIMKENFEKKRRRQIQNSNEDVFDFNILDSNRMKDCYLIGSSMSSASMILGSYLLRNNLLRECDVDKVLELLHDCNYDTHAALKSLKEKLYNISTVWTQSERDLYDNAYRLHQSTAALREISQTFATPEIANDTRVNNNVVRNQKTTKDIVDYHHRFKITDQFRKAQDKKREHALRMLEVIESRRTIHDIIVLATNKNDPNKDSGSRAASPTSLLSHPSASYGDSGTAEHKHTNEQDAQQLVNTEVEIGNNQGMSSSMQHRHWSDKTIASVAIERDEHIRVAKRLLIDVRDSLGSDVMKDIAEIIRKLHLSYDPQIRERVFQLLPNQPGLQNRFLEFLPRAF